MPRPGSWSGFRPACGKFRLRRQVPLTLRSCLRQTLLLGGGLQLLGQQTLGFRGPVSLCGRDTPTDDQGQADGRRGEYDRLITADELSESIDPGWRTGFDRFVVQIPLDVPGQSRRGFVTPCAFLLQRLHYDPVQLAAE